MSTNYFSYKIEHDFGLAPNPFGPYCTLAVCKPQIRNNKRLTKGDWIFGTGSSKLKKLNHLVYAMQMSERITFQEYWEDERFQYKKPIVNGSLVQMHGDNFYHQDTNTGKWIQENSAHSHKNGEPNLEHLKRDTGGEYVIIADTFYYFGNNAIEIPKKFLEVCSEGRNYKSVNIPSEIGDQFILWLAKNHPTGIHGEPISWIKYYNKKLP